MLIAGQVAGASLDQDSEYSAQKEHLRGIDIALGIYQILCVIGATHNFEHLRWGNSATMFGSGRSHSGFIQVRPRELASLR